MSRRNSPIISLQAGVGGGFTPLAHGTALKLWRSSDVDVTTSGDDVTAWGDRVAGGDDAVVPPGGVSPELLADAQNGLPGIDFAAPASGNVALAAADSGIDDFWAGGGGMLVTAFIMDDAIGGRVLSKGFGSDDPGNSGWAFRGSGSPFPIRLRFEHEFSGGNYTAFTNANFNGGPVLVVYVWDGQGNSDPTVFRLNGINNFGFTNNPSGSIAPDASADLNNGSRAVLNGANLRGKLLEYYLVKPAPASVAPDEQYINDKWAIF